MLNYLLKIFGFCAALILLNVASAQALSQTSLRYKISADGASVLDTRAHLIWKRCSEGQTWNGASCVGEPSVFDLGASFVVTRQQSRWRLPNVKELSSLVDRLVSPPSINKFIFPDTPSSTYWTSTPHNQIAAWAVDFSSGATIPMIRGTPKNHVRLVMLAPPESSGMLLGHGLNDTGVGTKNCYALSAQGFVDCDGQDALALSSMQDAMVGRDVTHFDKSDGVMGFSFSLVARASNGFFDKTECFKDNVSGLIWEGKLVGSGLRGVDRRFTNFDNAQFPQKRTGNTAINPNLDEIQALANAASYVAEINASALCGFKDWRLPTIDELFGVVNMGDVSTVRFGDPNWFLEQPLRHFWWSSTPFANLPTSAWHLNTYVGRISGTDRSSPGYVRLVRAN